MNTVKGSVLAHGLAPTDPKSWHICFALLMSFPLVGVASVNANSPVDPLFTEGHDSSERLPAAGPMSARVVPEVSSSVPPAALALPGAAFKAVNNPADEQGVMPQAISQLSPIEDASSDDEAKFQACAKPLLEILEGVELHYQAVYKSIGVDSYRVLKRLTDDNWSLQSHAEWLFFSIDEQSHFHMPDWTLISFDHVRKGMSDRHNVAVRVVSEVQKYTARARGETKVFEFDGILFDELNHQIKLQLDVACQPEATQFQYTVAKRKGIRQYNYAKKGIETVATAAGDFQAIRLEKVSGERKTTIWLAPELAYSVVKLVYKDGDDSNSMTIKTKPRLSPLP